MVSPFSPIASCRIIVTFLPQLFEHSKACPPRTLALWGSAISGSGTITTTFSAPARASTAWPRTFLKILSARAWSMTRTTSHSPVRSFLTGRIWPKDGIDLFGVGNLLSLEHATARLIDHPVSQFTVVGDFLAKFVDGQLGDQILAARFPGLLQYFSCAVHDLFGYSDELAIFLGLSLVPFLGRQPLDFLHPTPCRPRAIAKPLNMLLNGLGETAD